MLCINGHEVRDKRFPDNTFRMMMDDCDFLAHYAINEINPAEHFKNMREMYSNPITAVISWTYEKPEELFMLQLLVMHCRDKLGVTQIHLIMPYIPNARMDRTKDPMGEVNVLKYFCQILNDLKFASVIVCDPHSDASVNQIERIIQFSMRDVVQRAFEKSGAKYIFFPDDGAAKRYGKIYNFAPFMNGKKLRDWNTGDIKGLELENPMEINPEDIGDSKILIIDDICSKGGTFWHAGLKLKEFGFKHIDLFVTHCEQAIFDGKLLTTESPIEMIYTTDTLKRDEHERISVEHIEI